MVRCDSNYGDRHNLVLNLIDDPSRITVARRSISLPFSRQLMIRPNVGFIEQHTWSMDHHFQRPGVNDPHIVISEHPTLSVDTMSKQGRDRIVPETAVLRLIFEGQGVAMNDWWTDLRQPTYRSNSGFGLNWGEWLAANDSSLESLPANSTDNDRKRYCGNLASLSREALQNYKVKPVVKPEPALSSSHYPAVFVNTCAKCHVDQEIGPSIPFRDPTQFAIWSRGDGRMNALRYRLFEAPEGLSMPPTRTLTETELSQVLKYLESLR